MRAEYEAIVGAGLLLQIDAPDLGMGRHTMYKDRSEAEYIALAERHVEALNHALRNVAADRIGMHLCGGNNGGPNNHDIRLRQRWPLEPQARPPARWRVAPIL